jgi:poly(hydroxyalkanoate) granule-associated protein
MTEQVNVTEPVAETKVEAQTGPKSMAEVARLMVLAGIGAAAIAKDEAKALMDKLIERGAAAQADVKKTAEELAERSKHVASDVAERSKEQSEQAQGMLEKQVETVLGKLNIPSKHDLNQLNARIDALSAKIDATMGEAEAEKTPAVPAGDSPVI